MGDAAEVASVSQTCTHHREPLCAPYTAPTPLCCETWLEEQEHVTVPLPAWPITGPIKGVADAPPPLTMISLRQCPALRAPSRVATKGISAKEGPNTLQRHRICMPGG